LAAQQNKKLNISPAFRYKAATNANTQNLQRVFRYNQGYFLSDFNSFNNENISFCCFSLPNYKKYSTPETLSHIDF
jgi:hypothetical protein